MKAIICTKYGTPDVLQLQEVAKPTPKANELLIKVHAASLNSWDVDLLKGDLVNRLLSGGWREPKLKILGCDVAGVVEAVGSQVQGFQPGDAVFGDLSGCGWGTLAEYVCATPNALTHKPATMSDEQAAAIPQAALLALQGLCHIRPLQAGQKVLINGAGGGVGSFAIQIAKAYGAQVTGVDSTDKLATMRSLGTDQVIDYTKEDFTQNGQQYDLILDVVARRSLSAYQRALAPGGLFVVVGGAWSTILQTALLGSMISRTEGQKLTLLMHRANQGIDQLIALFEAGKVVPVIDQCYPLSETAEAFRKLAAGQAKGKVVIRVMG